ncbi:MAG: Chromosome partition protein Smc [Dehalococcoidia bacterium]|nr:Chromosome partition protein Smc [Bacillota bacterium]MBT9142683.1 Chromosome partition protein Smc [Bacillota bacterium]
MILRQVTLENWGIFRDHFEVEFTEGINILSGLNETGKTTVVDAIRTCFFDKHTTNALKIHNLVPWGSSLSPTVTIIFEAGDDEYRIEKRFLYSPISRLEKKVNSNWKRIAEGDKADIQVAELTGGELSSRGASKPENWGLGQVLWTKQGDTLPGKLNEETFDKLQSIVGSAITSAEEKNLFERLSRELDEVLTKKTRKPKANSPLDEVLNRIQDLEAKKTELDGKWRGEEQLERTIADLQIELDRQKGELQVAEKELNDAKIEAGEARKHEKERVEIKGQVDLLHQKWNSLHAKIERINSLQKAIENSEKEIKANKSLLEVLQKERDEINNELESGKRELEGIEKNIESDGKSLKYVRIAHDTIEKERRELVGLEEISSKAEKFTGEMKNLQSKLENLLAPTKGEFNELKNIHSKLNEKEAQLSAIGLGVLIRAENEISVTLYLDGQKAAMKIPPGEEKKWEAAQHVRMKIESVGELEISSGSRDVKELRTEVEELRQQYGKRTAIYNTAEIGKLEELANKRSNLEDEIRRVNGRISELAPEGIEKLKGQVAELRESIRTNWQKIPDDSPYKRFGSEKDKDLARIETVKIMDALEEGIGDWQNQRVEKRQKQAEIERQLSEKNVQIRGTENTIEYLKGEQERSKKDLEELQQDGLSMEERKTGLKSLAVELERKRMLLDHYDEEKMEKEERPLQRLERAEKRLKEVEKDVRETESTLSGEKGRLDQLLQEGIYTERNKVEEQLESLLRKKNDLEIEVKAIELLYDLFNFYQDQTLESVAEPVRNMVLEDFKRVVGPRYSGIELDESMMPSAVELTNWDKKAEVALLSYGTREQLGLLVRLALGQILAKDERQIIILDDPLTNTDDIRLKHCLQIVEEAAKKLQVILLTCHPARYASIESRNVVSMGAY